MTSTYTTIEGTEPSIEEAHEPRTILREEEDHSIYMMTEIEDGVFVQWGSCRSCNASISRCKCKTGPVAPDYINRWREERFERSIRHRRPSERLSEPAEEPVQALEEPAKVDLDVAIEAVKTAKEAEEKDV